MSLSAHHCLLSRLSISQSPCLLSVSSASLSLSYQFVYTPEERSIVCCSHRCGSNSSGMSLIARGRAIRDGGCRGMLFTDQPSRTNRQSFFHLNSDAKDQALKRRYTRSPPTSPIGSARGSCTSNNCSPSCMRTARTSLDYAKSGSTRRPN